MTVHFTERTLVIPGTRHRIVLTLVALLCGLGENRAHGEMFPEKMTIFILHTVGMNGGGGGSRTAMLGSFCWLNAGLTGLGVFILICPPDIPEWHKAPVI